MVVLTETQEKLQDIAPYGMRNGELLSPEQRDIIAPVIDLCAAVLSEGEEAILLGSRALAPYVLTQLEDPEQYRNYILALGQKDFDLHVADSEVYIRFREKLTNTQASYKYGFRGTQGPDTYDVVNNQELATNYLAGIRGAIIAAEEREFSVDVSKDWLQHVERGDVDYIIPLTRIYSASATGVRLVKKDGKIVAEAFDPLNFLKTIKVRDGQLQTYEPVNPYSARYYLLNEIGYTRFSPDPYKHGIKAVPEVLTDTGLDEITNSTLGELPSVAKTLVTHGLSVSSPYFRTIYYAMKVLARIDPEFAIQNQHIEKYANSARALLVSNLNNFEEILALMLHELPLGWCIYPEDGSTISHIRNRTVSIGSDVAGVDTSTLSRVRQLVEKNGNPKNLNAALGMYVVAERGRRHPSNTNNEVDSQRFTRRIANWWQRPDISEEAVLRYFNYYDATLYDAEK